MQISSEHARNPIKPAQCNSRGKKKKKTRQHTVMQQFIEYDQQTYLRDTTINTYF